MYFDPIYPKDHLILINILAYFPTRKLTDIYLLNVDLVFKHMLRTATRRARRTAYTEYLDVDILRSIIAPFMRQC